MMREVDIGAKLVPWLEESGWDVYQEVETGMGICDIVAVQDHLLWVVELKLRLGLSVMGQAAHWKPYAHFVSVGVPLNRIGARGFPLAVLKTFGIGLIRVGAEVSEDHPPPLNRHAVVRYIRPRLCPEQKRYAPAGSTGGHFTPFKRTCEAVLAEAVKRPGLTMKELVDAIDHHYSKDQTARCHLANWIRRGKVPGVRLDMTGGKLLVYPAEGGAT